jgi:hypothetical protein
MMRNALKTLLAPIINTLLRSCGVLPLLLSSLFLTGGYTIVNGGDSLSTPIRYIMTVSAGVILLFSIDAVPVVGVGLMLVYLVLMGTIRRELIPLLGYEKLDPLTMLSCMVSGVYFIRMLARRQIVRDTLITRWLVVFLGIMAVAVFNPLQGANLVIVGLSGVFTYMTPIFWFFIGRNSGKLQMIAPLSLVFLVVAVLTSSQGLWQVQNGFSDLERFWVSIAGTSQKINATDYRPIGLSNSFSEYYITVAMGCMICWTQFIRRKFLYALPLGFLFFALIMSSARSGLVNVLLGMMIIWAIQSRQTSSWIPRLIVSAIFAVGAVFYGAQQVGDVGTGTSGDIVRHQISGLTDPTHSSAGGHQDLFLSGIATGFTHPFGYGLGVSTASAARFGSDAVGGSEVDVSNMFISTGFIGGTIYFIACVSVYITLLNFWRQTRRPEILIVVGLCASNTGQWLSGTHYSSSMFLWFLVGTIDRAYRDWQRQQKATNATAAEATAVTLATPAG